MSEDNNNSKVLYGVIVIILIFAIVDILITGLFIPAPLEKLKSATLVNAFCKDNGYDYGVSYYVGDFQKYAPHAPYDVIAYDKQVVCVRTVEQKEVFLGEFNRWSKDKILIKE